MQAGCDALPPSFLGVAHAFLAVCFGHGGCCVGAIFVCASVTAYARYKCMHQQHAAGVHAGRLAISLTAPQHRNLFVSSAG